MNEILIDLEKRNLITTSVLTKEELIKSQKGNLNTKKERQYSRYKFYNLIKKRIPHFDGGYNTDKSNIKNEIKVYIVQKILYFLEKVGLYLKIAKIINRVKI